jgi:U2 small nuclear ribonucleoprotein B''
MAEVSVAPDAPEAMQDVISTEPTPSVPAEPEFISETLYIQNLNEKIKVDGPQSPFFTLVLKTDTQGYI